MSVNSVYQDTSRQKNPELSPHEAICIHQTFKNDILTQLIFQVCSPVIQLFLPVYKTFVPKNPEKQ